MGEQVVWCGIGAMSPFPAFTGGSLCAFAWWASGEPTLVECSVENYFSGWCRKGYLLEHKLGLFLRGLWHLKGLCGTVLLVFILFGFCFGFILLSNYYNNRNLLFCKRKKSPNSTILIVHPFSSFCPFMFAGVIAYILHPVLFPSE